MVKTHKHKKKLKKQNQKTKKASTSKFLSSSSNEHELAIHIPNLSVSSLQQHETTTNTMNVSTVSPPNDITISTPIAQAVTDCNHDSFDFLSSDSTSTPDLIMMILMRSRGQWLLRRYIFTPNFSRDQCIASNVDLVMESLRLSNQHAKFDSFATQTKFDHLINSSLRGSWIVTWDLALTKLDRKVRDVVRIWRRLIFINNESIIQRQPTFWMFTLFVTLQCSNRNAIDDRGKIFSLLHQLLHGEAVPEKEILYHITTAFASVVGGLA